MKLLDPILSALRFDLPPDQLSAIEVLSPHADSRDGFAVTDLAASSFAAVGLALRAFTFGDLSSKAFLTLDQRLAYLWFESSIRPQGWQMAPLWDDLAGDYQALDGWVRLHTNAKHHRKAACSVLGNLDRDEMARKIAAMPAYEVEQAVVEQGGAAATMMDDEAWGMHPQGCAVTQEPLIASQFFDAPERLFSVDSARPLAGLKVLDLTRILAGPVATRTLAAFGADVLRIDPPGWQEGDYIIDLTAGKKCATLDLKSSEGVQLLSRLIKEADIFVHGYRADALAQLGLGEEVRRALNPALIDVALNAYGWSGPWANRRGFDSLVQMSSGIAAHGMALSGSDKPRPMSVQALDHATGYLMAASVLMGLYHLKSRGQSSSWRLSLAATAALLKQTRRDEFGALNSGERQGDFYPDMEVTGLGIIKRLQFPFVLENVPAFFAYPASLLHQSPASF